MDAQDYIIGRIEPEMNETGKLGWLKHITETSLIDLPADSYPALIVEDDEPLGLEGTFGDGGYINKRGSYNMALIVETKQLNKMERADYRQAKRELAKRAEELQQFLFEAFVADPRYTSDDESVTLIGLGVNKGPLDFVDINGTACLMLMMRVDAKWM